MNKEIKKILDILGKETFYNFYNDLYEKHLYSPRDKKLLKEVEEKIKELFNIE